ncbi:MAG: class 1 fructose-bisphosphatase [Hyphomicrobiaceae bacterium]
MLDINAQKNISLQEYLAAWSGNDRERGAVFDTLMAITNASIELQALLVKGALAGDLGSATGCVGGGDDQKELDRRANDIFIENLAKAPVAAVASEEMEHALDLDDTNPLIVALDPLDGSSNIETNVTVGVMFSVLPKLQAVKGDANFLQPGSRQVAAGIVVYGPQTTFLLTVGDGAHVFTLDGETRSFLCTHPNVAIPPTTREYAINDSNYCQWDEAVRVYVDDCRLGRDGPRIVDFNMRWVGSFVAEISRIFSRGGIYLYPGDNRKGYEKGRLRLIYEVNPAAWLIEQAGGKATTGQKRILDLVPTKLHGRAPLICGSFDEVDYVCRIFQQPVAHADRSPLFKKRSFFYF